MLVNVLSVSVSPESVANALALYVYLASRLSISDVGTDVVETHVLLWTTPTANHLCLLPMCVGFCHAILFHAMFMKCHAFVCHATPCGPLAATVRDTGQLVLAHTVPRQSAAATRGLPLRGPPFEDLPSRPPFARPPFRVLPLEAFLCEATLSRPSPLLPSRSPLHRAVDPRDPPGRSLAPCTGHIFHKFRAGSLSILLLRFYDTCNSVVHYSQGT